MDSSTFTVNLTGANDAPSDISLIGRSVDENAAGEFIGVLSVTDPDVNDIHTLNVDDSRFEIVNDYLKLKDGIYLDYDVDHRVDVVVTATDSLLESYSETFTINVIEVDISTPKVVSFVLTDESDNGVVTIGESSTVTIEFSEAVKPFDAAQVFDLTNAAGDLGIFNSVDGGITWTAAFIPTTVPAIERSNCSITLKDASVSDLQGYFNAGTLSSTQYSVDTILPTPSLTVEPIVTASGDNIVNIVEATGNVQVTGKVAGEFNEGDVVTISLQSLYSTALFTGAVDVAGNFSIDVAGSALSNDLNTKLDASITTTDLAGNQNTVILEDAASYQVDVTAPVPSIELAGNIATDDIVNSAEEAGNVLVSGQVSGEFEEGDIVTLTLVDSGNVTSTFTGPVDAAGDFSINVSGSALVSDADKLIHASVSTYDSAENLGTATDIDGYQVDIVKPPRPLVAEMSDDTGSSASDGYTSDTTPTLAGWAEQNSWISVYRDGVLVDDTIVADLDGAWSYTPGVALNNGPYEFTVTATDLAGNISDLSTAFNVTVDATAPGKPSIDLVTDNVEPQTGSIAFDGFTNDRTPTLEGTAEAFSQVDIYDGVTLVGTTYAASDGKWTFTTPVLTEETSYNFTVKAVDLAGNESEASDPFVLHVTTEVPIPTVEGAIDNIGVFQGTLTSDSYTDDLRPELIGKAKAGSTVRIYEGTSTIPTAITLADGVTGDWSWIPSSDLIEGVTYSYTVTAEDGAGNVSEKSDPFVVNIDGSVPTPAITAVTDDVLPVTGTLISGAYTNDSQPTFSGLAEANSTVTIYNDDTQIGATLTSSSGLWSFNPSTPLTDGFYSITTTATDLASNISDRSAAFTLNVDTVKPITPVIGSVNDNQNPVTGTVANGGHTNDTTPTLTGTASVGDTVHLYDNGIQVWSTQVTTGTWSYTPAVALAEEAHNYTITATDLAGNVSDPSPAYVVNVDTTTPSTPVVSVIDDVFPVEQTTQSVNLWTNDTLPTLTGTVEPFGTVIVRLSSQIGPIVATVATDDTGVWSFTPSGELADASWNPYYLAVEDRAGNTSEYQYQGIRIDTTLPEAIITDVGDNIGGITGSVASGETTDDTRPTLYGTTELMSTVEIFNFGVSVGTAVVNNTAWNFVTPLLGEGDYSFTAIATDRAGNISIESAPYLVTVDLTPPAQPEITSLSDDVLPQTDPVANGGFTNDTTPTLSGTAEPNSTVTIKDGVTTLGTAPVDADGNWTYTPVALNQGSHSFTATASDAAGNTGSASVAFAVTIDTESPAAPGVDVTDNVDPVQTALSDGDSTNDTTPTLSGSAEAFSTVTVTDNGSQVYQFATDATGYWEFTPTALAHGSTHPYAATATDRAGNVSDTTSLTLTIDTQAPGQPTIESVTDDVAPTTGNVTNGGATNDTQPTLSGKAEAGSTVNIYIGADPTPFGTTTADEN
ncbi:MAG: Ig-like domain-containing protein, partial [Desulfuromonadales bacterium]|nr:Ig-like domain-containing protein [Desulfuromonadales bacterium]